ncbi:MAG: ABATE domain-containing protein [Alphaproteobacteria bacterium]|nr:ABATE domain-containing protein [Alphaproteobacteria bacterium]
MRDDRISAALPEDRDGFRFRGGSSALDLAATLQARLKPSPRELLATPQDLGRWLVSARLATSAPVTNEADLEIARALREAIYTVASSLDAHPLDAGACDALNRIAAGAPAIPVLKPEGRVALEGSPKALLASLAREAVHLFGGENAQRVRQCQSPSCTIFFVDTSRSGHRRWCSMAACGNKAKVAALRRRQRGKVVGD